MSKRRSDGARRYNLKARADKQSATRARIVDAAMALHEELGPRETTISAIAERAGVQRLTVYRHFRDEQELFSACTSKWLELHPPPQLDALTEEREEPRTREALTALYRYYRRTTAMWTAAYRDVDRVPALREPMLEFGAYLRTIEDDLLRRYGTTRTERPLLATAIRHALEFSTWQSLSAAKARHSDAVLARLVTRWILTSR